MARAGVANSKIFLLMRENKRVNRPRHLSKLRGAEDWAAIEKSSKNEESDDEVVKRGSSSSSWRSSWVPDPRTGIYFPKGHEWVMDDVPKGAASLNPTFWLRNVDGVLEKPDPDTPPDHYYHQMKQYSMIINNS